MAVDAMDSRSCLLELEMWLRRRSRIGYLIEGRKRDVGGTGNDD